MGEETSLKPEEVAGILKITKNTVYELIKRGELKAYRIGRKIRVDFKDVEAYKNKGKGIDIPTIKPVISSPTLFQNESSAGENKVLSMGLVIYGQDILLDILSRYLERHPAGQPALRCYAGSFAGLNALYQGKASMTAVHLWDGDDGVYNIPYVRRLLPGFSTVLIHLAFRMQGFYVAKGNPKGITDWMDLARPDVIFVNREKGSGTRVLLDEKLRSLGIEKQQIQGYGHEEYSHLAVASAVSRGEADAGLGNEKSSLQVRGVDFVPKQKERYELVIKKDDLDKPPFQAVLEILRSREFQGELQGLGDYDLSKTGQIVAEI